MGSSGEWTIRELSHLFTSLGAGIWLALCRMPPTLGNIWWLRSVKGEISQPPRYARAFPNVFFDYIYVCGLDMKKKKSMCFYGQKKKFL